MQWQAPTSVVWKCVETSSLQNYEVQISSDMLGQIISQTTSCLHPIMRRVSTGSWQNRTNTPQENRKDRSEKGPLNAQRCYIMLQSNNPMPSDFHNGPQREYIQDLKSDIQHIQMYPHNISTCTFIFFPTPCNQTWFAGEIPQFGEFTMGTIKNLINSANDPSNHPSLVGGWPTPLKNMSHLGW